MAILIVLVGVVTITRMSTDIFPNINIPVVSVIWSYAGVAPEEMEKRFVTVSERAMTTTVNDIEHIESQSYNGVNRRFARRDSGRGEIDRRIKARKRRRSINFDQVRARMQKTANDGKGKLYG